MDTEGRIRKALDSLVYIPSLRDTPDEGSFATHPTGTNSPATGDTQEEICRPWDRQDLYRRLRTFKASTWNCKPDIIGPVSCARHGWVNIAIDMLSCEFCKAKLSCQFLPMLSPEDSQEAAESFLHKLTDAHDATCAWRGNASAPHIAQFPPLPKERVVAEFSDRFDHLMKLDPLPAISDDLLQELDEESRLRLTAFARLGPTPDTQPPLECIDSALPPGESLLTPPASSSTELGDVAGDDHMLLECWNSIDQRSKAARLLSLFGWNVTILPFAIVNQGKKPFVNRVSSTTGKDEFVDANRAVLSCAICGVRQGLWNLSSPPTEQGQNNMPSQAIVPQARRTAAAAPSATVQEEPIEGPKSTAVAEVEVAEAERQPSIQVELFGQTIAGGAFGSTGSDYVSSVPAAGTPSMGAANTPNTSATGPFGTSSTPVFGTPATGPFGTASTPVFGTSATGPFGTASTPVFGMKAAAAGPFGRPVEGRCSSTVLEPSTSAPGPYGQTAAPAFGSRPSAAAKPPARLQGSASAVTPLTKTPVVDKTTLGTFVAGFASPAVSSLPIAATAPPAVGLGPFGSPNTGRHPVFGIAALKQTTPAGTINANGKRPAPTDNTDREGVQKHAKFLHEFQPSTGALATAGANAVEGLTKSTGGSAAAGARTIAPGSSTTAGSGVMPVCTARPCVQPHPPTSTINPMQEHRSWCPWVASVSGGDVERCGWHWCLDTMTGGTFSVTMRDAGWHQSDWNPGRLLKILLSKVDINPTL